MSQPVQLSDVAIVFNGKTPAVAEQRTQGHPVLKVRDVDDVGCFRGDFENFVDRSLAEAFRKKWIESGDTLILNAAHNSDYVGSKTYYASAAVSGAMPTGEWLVVRARPETASKRYLYYWLTSPKSRSHIRDRVRGIHLYPKDVAELRLSLPPLSQQEHIAAVLDKADAIRCKRREALKLTDEFLRSSLLDVALRVRDGSLAGRIESLGNLLSKNENAIRTGPFGSDLLHSEFATAGIPVVGIENAVTNRFRWTEPRCISAAKYQDLRRYRIFPGDVIVTIMGTTGRVCVAPSDLPECISTKHLCVMTPNRDKVTSNYLWASLLFDPFVRRQAAQAGKGAIMEGWNMTIVKSLDIAIPSSTTLNRFDAAVNRCETIRARHELALAESENLFRSLTSRVFSGELGGI